MKRLALACAALAVAGCFGTAMPHFFTLSAAGTAPPVSTQPELGLAVGPVDLPRYLDRPEIVSRDGENRLTVADDHRWAGSLRSDIQRLTADELGRLLGTARIATYPDQARFTANYRVLLDVRECEAVSPTSVRVRIRWTLAAVPDGHALWVEESTSEQPIASDSYADIVAAESRGVEDVALKIASQINRLSAGEPSLAVEKQK